MNEVQDYLHNKGKQLPVNVFNNGSALIMQKTKSGGYRSINEEAAVYGKRGKIQIVIICRNLTLLIINQQHQRVEVKID